MLNKTDKGRAELQRGQRSLDQRHRAVLQVTARHQAVIECPQGGNIGAPFDQGAITDQNASAVGGQAGEEGFARWRCESSAGNQERGQRQLAGAGEGLMVIGAAGQLRKGRAVQLIGKVVQHELCKITVMRRKSCQPRKKIKQNQQLADYSGLSSVDWAKARAEHDCCEN